MLTRLVTSCLEPALFPGRMSDHTSMPRELEERNAVFLSNTLASAPTISGMPPSTSCCCASVRHPLRDLPLTPDAASPNTTFRRGHQPQSFASARATQHTPLSGRSGLRVRPRFETPRRNHGRRPRWQLLPTCLPLRLPHADISCIEGLHS